MTSTSDLIPEPILQRALDGTWLALTPPEAVVRYGALGRTRQEACTAFAAAGERIVSALSDPADPASVRSMVHS